MSLRSFLRVSVADINDLFTRGKFDEVIEHTNDIASFSYSLTDKMRAELLILRGDSFDKRGQHGLAAKAYTAAEEFEKRVAMAPPRIVSDQPAPAPALPTPQEMAEDAYNAAKVEYDKKEYDAAIKLSEEAVAFNSVLEKAWQLLMWARYNAGKYDATILAATKGIALNGSMLADFFKFRSFSYYTFYTFDKRMEAGNDAENAIKHGCSDPAIYANLAFKKLQDKDYQATIKAATDSIAYKDIQNSTAHAYLYLAQAKLALQDYEGALADAKQCAMLKPDKYWDIRDQSMACSKAFIKEYLKVIADSYQMLIAKCKADDKLTDALKKEREAFNYRKTREPLPLASLCKFFILQQHGKVVAAAPAHFRGDFDGLRAVLAKHDITPESIHIIREIQQIPVAARDLFDVIDREEKHRAELHEIVSAHKI